MRSFSLKKMANEAKAMSRNRQGGSKHDIDPVSRPEGYSVHKHIHANRRTWLRTYKNV